NPEWPQIAELLRRQGLNLWLLTSGLSLAKHARRAAELFDAITVSLDGTDPMTYAAIRGLDAFDKVCEGIRATARAGTPVSVRVTLQRANYRQLPLFVGLARELGARQVSFLSVDVANPHAFARQDDFTRDLALRPEDLPELAAILDELERDGAEGFRSGLIADSPRKLRAIHQYFSAVCGLAEYPQVRCNVYEYSAVIGASGRVSPCFFISGPRHSSLSEQGLADVLSHPSMSTLREQIRSGTRPECSRCVCSLWRSAGSRGAADFLPPRVTNA
ncbi:MAG: radical SAM protein, partial [Gammaproteobacteria bacterium]|nr:radical SAM protein [Gammaproteobacteria bacterium]